MPDIILNQPSNHIWRQLDIAPQGEADPMIYHDSKSSALEERGELKFSDLIDIVNPLHHIPIVSDVYQKVSGDQIADVPKFIGGALFGGPVGLIAALGNFIIKAEIELEQKTSQEILLADQNRSSEIKSTPNTTPNPASNSFSINHVNPNQHVVNLTESKTLNSPFPIERSRPLKVFKIGPRDTPVVKPIETGISNSPARSDPKLEAPIQEVKGNALDRLIQASKLNENKQLKTIFEHRIPTNSLPLKNRNLHHWMLQTLEKYEKMGKR